ncbi:TonB-dependent receptor [Sphingomonas sp. KR3-1]|uniref:TonB-dependent receptor n=1 Tax=Sphingomonas sp. KR3-1 TaxID=3156611 RepID=UPI0032B41AFD
MQDLARQTGAELLFDRAALRGYHAPRLRGRMTIDAALRALIGDTSFVAHRGASGAWVVTRRPVSDEPPPPEDLAEPEILVVGRRSQNVDIPRQENGIQPYQVSTRAEIVSAHRDDLDQYFRSRVTANTQAVPSSQNGATNSLIDLRGLGTDQTLILVDGRRLPSVPREPLTFQQPDLNAIPLHAIERVETLTGTAGGIYGFGALGGMVNVILRRDLHGLELHGTTGISTRGDAGRLSLEGGFGFSPDGGDTDLMLYVSQRWEQAVREGERGYVLRGRELAAQFLPDEVSGKHSPINANAINVFAYNFDTDQLVFRPEYGGAALASNRTFLPRGFSGSAAEMVAALTGNAGRTDLTPSNETQASDIGSTPTTGSAIFSVRHRFGGGVEAYVDGLMLRNQGRYRSYASNGEVLLRPGDPGNPFQNLVLVTFPAPSALEVLKVHFSTDRFTGGLVVPLSLGWKATAEASFGAAHFGSVGSKQDYFSFGQAPSTINPFGDWESFQRALAGDLLNSATSFDSYNRYREQSLRVAGPLFRTAAGAATLTVLGQNRAEKVPTYTVRSDADYDGPDPSYFDYADRGSSTRSLSVELDAPLVAEDARVPLLNGLTLQLALRHDDQSVDFYADEKPDADKALRARFAGTNFTAGAKVLPRPWLMLRGSYATGQQPPLLSDLVEFDTLGLLDTLADPKRGNAMFSESGTYLNKLAGSPDLKPVRASTLALGIVLNPRGEGGPRVSIDYSRIRRTGDPVWIDSAYVIANEERLPGRVTRLPLTDADRARGYTGGVVTMIDARTMNLGTFLSESVDARFDWILPFADGTLRANGAATFQIHNISHSPLDPPEEVAGYQGGPLRWRANGGPEWTRGRTTLGMNVQYFSRYRVLTSDIGCCASVETLQGSPYVAGQTYLDLYASRRFQLDWAGKPREFSIDLGLVNLLNTAPPYVAQLRLVGPMYSPYGDIRQRRVELSVNTRF